MGRGNSCTWGKYEGLYYVDFDRFKYDTDIDEDGNVESVFDDYAYEDFLELFYEDMMDIVPSFKKCDRWISREEHAVLENRLFYVVLEDNDWSLCVKLIQKEQSYYERGNIENLQAGQYKRVLEKIKQALFNQVDELGIYDGAWTHGTIKKEATNNV